MGYCPCFGWTNGKKEHSSKCKPQLSSVESKSIAGLTSEPSAATAEPNDGTRALTFNYQQLAKATKNFSKESLIGQGGFGAVYKGKLKSTGQLVAVKQLDKTGLQGEKEFLVEVLMLSLLRHRNLVNLIGYCAEGDQRLLVYEYMQQGSLEDHLHYLTPDQKPLDWITRMTIAAGAAKGLEYLHTEANPPLITGRKALDDSRAREERFLVDWAQPLSRDGKNISNLADPLLRGHFSKSTMKKALEVAFLCIQEDANCRPSISDIVLALNYLTSHPYGAHGAAKRVSEKVPEHNKPPNETTGILDRDFNRERAVAEAKMWGESWRDKRLQRAENASHASNR
ncbi:hypothetical protein GQ457_07G000300 [Hibiscus cannabinus]